MSSPTYRVEFEGVDVSALIADRLISMTVRDAADDSSDSFTLTLDNRDDAISFPKVGGSIQVWMGWGFDLVLKGTFFTDEVSEDLTSGEIEIQAKATKMTTDIKAPKTRTWEKLTLGQLAEKIAAAQGLVCKVHASLSGVNLGHINQKAESDLAMLRRLCRKHDGMMKVFHQNLVITPKGSGQTASGSDIPLITISDPARSEGRVTMQEKGVYSCVQAAYFDEDRQSLVNIKVGEDDGPTLVLKGREKDAASAYAKADAKLKEVIRGEASMSLSRPLTPDIVAPGKVKVIGHRKSANGIWYVESVDHTIGGGGYASSAMNLSSEAYEAKEKKVA
ncbi:MAG: hypothetical protein ACRDC7_02140 [Aeromonas veronii]